MKDKKISSIVIPLLFIIFLFFITIFIIIIPYLKSSFIENETKQIKMLVESQIQIMESLNTAVEKNKISLSEAKERAIEIISEQRYGKNLEFYFWIIDLDPVLIMHPFTKNLVGKYVGDYYDENGNNLFQEMVDIVKTSGEGYLEYLWQLPYDENKVIEKKSFVKLYEPWGWIIGTGFYINNLSQEINSLFTVITILSVVVLVMIIVLSWAIFLQRLVLNRQKLYYAKNFVESEKRYKKLITSMNEGFVLSDTDFRIQVVNKKLLEMIGKPENEVIGEYFRKFVHKEWLQEYDENIENRKKGGNEKYEIALKGSEGKAILAIVSPRGMFDENNNFMGSYAVITDVSRLKKVQLELETTLEEREALIKEIHHRVKNNLQIIISIFNLQKIKHVNKEFNDFLIESETRIFSMALVHEILYESPKLDSISFDRYLEKLIDNIRMEFLAEKIDLVYECDGYETVMSLEKATAAGIIITELLMKYYHFFKNGNFEILESLKVKMAVIEETYRISFIAEYRCGLKKKEIRDCYFEMNLIVILLEQLQGRIDIMDDEEDSSSGLGFIIEIPVDRTF